MDGALVITGPTPEPAGVDWVRAAEAAGARRLSAEELPGRPLNGGFDCVIIDGRLGDAVGIAHRVHRADAAVQTCIVAGGAARRRVERGVLFTPGLGEVWIVDPVDVNAALLRRAADVTAQRRSYRTVHARIRHDLAGIEPYAARRAYLSDAFLAALLAVLPDPVVAIDDDGRVLSWNPAAERVTGILRSAAIGARLTDLLRSAAGPEQAGGYRAAPPDLFESHEAVEGVVDFRQDGHARTVEVRMVPVDAAGRRARVVVMRDVTEQRRAQQELAQRITEAELARAEAEAANRAKSDFLATMSHEIRTPINAIVGYTDLLEMGLSGPLTDVQRGYLERVRWSSRHLLSLVDDVLDLARIEAGRMSIAQESNATIRAVASAIALVAPQAEERRITIEAPPHRQEQSEPGAYYVGDEARVRQILVNLLSNAVKFSEPGSRVVVSYGEELEQLPFATDRDVRFTWIRVTDTGVGIPAADLDRIFQAFEQVDQGSTRTVGGTGLGLAISRQLARLMDGELTAESEIGRGSRFTLWLPQERPGAEPGLHEALAGVEPAPGTAAIGHALLSELATIIETVTRRIRADPLIPAAAELEDAVIANHAAAYIADLADTLVALGTTSSGELLRDGSEIQRIINRLHAEQRAGLGWTVEALGREFRILTEEIVRAARRHGGPDVDAGLRVVERIMLHGEATAREHFLVVLAQARNGTEDDPSS